MGLSGNLHDRSTVTPSPEYLRQLVRTDLDQPAKESGDISAIFSLGNSGGSDVAANKDMYVAEAVATDRAGS